MIKKIILSVFALLAGAAIVRAEIIAADSFDYPDGPLAGQDGGTGWSGVWDNGAAQVLSSNAITTAVNANNRRAFPLQTGDFYYMVNLCVTGETDNTYTALAGADYNTSETAYFGFRNNSYYLKVFGNDTGSEDEVKTIGTYTQGETVRLVMKVEINGNGTNEVVSLWVNPTSELDEPMIVVDSVDTGVSRGKHVRLRTYSLGEGTATWENFAAATTFEDLIPQDAVTAGAVVVDEQFDYPDYTDLSETAGWDDQDGSTNACPVIDGIAKLRYSAKFTYEFTESYAVDPSETGADNHVDSLWLRIRTRIPGDDNSSFFRPGLGASSRGSTPAFGKYANLFIAQNSASNAMLNLTVFSQGVESANPDPLPVYDGTEFVDIYGKLLDDGTGELKVSYWFNPVDPTELYAPDVSRVAPYLDSKIIDRIEMQHWNVDGTASHEVDEIVIGTTLNAVLPLPVPEEGYAAFEYQYDLQQGPDGDDDGDGLSNLYEYGLGGDPINPLDQGISPDYTVVAEGEMNWFGYVYPMLSDENSGIIYSLEVTPDLVSGVWTNTGIDVIGTNVTAGTLNFVSNRVSTVNKAKQFIKLVIEQL